MRTRLVLAALLTAGLSAAAFAHAQLTSASPAAGSTVVTTPSEVAISYSQALEPRFSAIEVQDASGARVDLNDVHAAPDSNRRLLVSLKPLPPGTYKVVWRATSIDTHKTEGSYTFTIRP